MNADLVDFGALAKEASELEPLPQSALRLAGILAHESWELESITAVVRFDEALTGRLLGVANSAVSGARAEVTTVDQAVLRLGAGKVLSMAVGAAVRERIQAALPILGVAEGELWRHSVASALGMDTARRHLSESIPAHAFVTALLHDVGKLVLERHLDASSAGELRQAREEGALSAGEAESEVLGVSHADVGALIVRSWGLPECIVEGIQFHHHPLSAPSAEARRLAYLVALADTVAVGVGEGCGVCLPDTELSPDVAGALGLPIASYQALRAEVAAQFEDVLRQYGG